MLQLLPNQRYSKILHLFKNLLKFAFSEVQSLVRYLKNYLKYKRLLQSLFYASVLKISSRETSTLTHTKFTNTTACSPYFKTFLLYKCTKIFHPLHSGLRLHSNIGKIIGKNVNNIFHIQNFGNFKTDFFLNIYLQIFLVKQVSSKNCSFYGLPL